MKNNKGKFIFFSLFILGIITIFINSSAFANDPDKDRRILTKIFETISKEHYKPKPFDDSLSLLIFNEYLKRLDESKTVFTAQDLENLSIYKYQIDDEITGQQPIQFVYEVNKIFNQKYEANNQFSTQFLNTPMQFNDDEYINLKDENLSYLPDDNARLERLRLFLKYQVLIKYNQELTDREKNKGNKDYQAKTDIQIEESSRNSILKNLERNYNRIKNQFNDEKKFDLFANTICEIMDPHSSFFPPIEKRSLQESLSGKFYGIGALLGYSEDGMKIISVQPGGPAWKSGQILANDLIIKVAQSDKTWVDLTGYEVTDAVKLIRGDKGTEVNLYIKKQNGTFITLSLIREEIVQDEVYARSVIIEKDKQKIGYIKLSEFYFNYENPNGEHNCSDDVLEEINKLKNSSIDKIVIDLRYNGGGSLNEVKKMVGFFIDKGPVVQVKDKNGQIFKLDDTESGLAFDGKIAVMVNEFSASASEIFAAAIQDYKRGIIVGSSSTFGKGTVQRPFPIGRFDYNTGETDLGTIKLTFQKFYRISGLSTQQKGVKSDIIIPDEAEIYHNREIDDEFALAWDTIPKLSYSLYEKSNEIIKKINQANQWLESDTVFNFYQNNLKFIDKQNNSLIPLQLTKYQQFVNQTNLAVNQNNKLIKLSQPLLVSVLPEDKDKYYNNVDKPKQDRYQAWLKTIETDKYIATTIDFLLK